jgi:hypothetical protein
MWWTGVEQASTGVTALHVASERDHVEVVTALLRAGAAVDARLVRVCGTMLCRDCGVGIVVWVTLGNCIGDNVG